MSDDTLTAPASTWLVPLLLLFLRDGISYGDELQERLDALGVDGMRPEETYQNLRKMEWEGLVRCDREDDGVVSPSGSTRSRRWARLTWSSGRTP